MTKEQLRLLIGENIRNERIARGMSIDELAEVLDLTPGFVGLIERGRRGATAHTLYKLSHAFDISLDVLFIPSDPDAIAAAQSEKDSTETLRKKISSMIVGLSAKEMDFMVDVIKGVRTMNHDGKVLDGGDRD